MNNQDYKDLADMIACEVCCIFPAIIEDRWCSEGCMNRYFESKSQWYSERNINSCQDLFDYMMSPIKED